MLTVNMQKHANPYNRRNHFQVSRGVNTDVYKQRRPSLQELMMENGAVGDGPKHLRDPFNIKDHQGEMLEYAKAVAEYNNYGRFMASSKSEASRKRAMHRMQMDSEIVGLTNHTRPKL